MILQVMRLEKELAAAIMAGERERKSARVAERALSASRQHFAKCEEQVGGNILRIHSWDFASASRGGVCFGVLP